MTRSPLEMRPGLIAMAQFRPAYSGSPVARGSVLALVLLSVAGLPGCASEQVYGAGQAWQRQECIKLMDSQERSRCMASVSMSYDEYKRQSEAMKAAR